MDLKFLRGFTKNGSPLLVENSTGGSADDWGDFSDQRVQRQAIVAAFLTKKKNRGGKAVDEEPAHSTQETLQRTGRG